MNRPHLDAIYPNPYWALQDAWRGLDLSLVLSNLNVWRIILLEQQFAEKDERDPDRQALIGFVAELTPVLIAFYFVLDAKINALKGCKGYRRKRYLPINYSELTSKYRPPKNAIGDIVNFASQRRIYELKAIYHKTVGIVMLYSRIYFRYQHRHVTNKIVRLISVATEVAFVITFVTHRDMDGTLILVNGEDN